MADAGLRLEIAWVEGGHGVWREAVVAGAADGIAWGVLRRLPAFQALLPMPADDCGLAVHGVRRQDDDPVFDGDRVEVLPPLQVDPKLARQRRVELRRREQDRDRWRPQR